MTELNKTANILKYGNLYGYTGGTYAYNVYGVEGLAPTLITMTGGGRQPMIIEDEETTMTDNPISTNGTEIAGTIRATYHKNGERNIIENVEHGRGYEGVVEPVVVASRGRNPENPSDRSAGIHLEQRLEINTSGTSNAITSVAKDNWLLEPQTVKPRYRIRKLTPKEVWRLQSFKDSDFERAAEVNANTNLYKQSGNSITRNVVVALLGQMFEGKENIYKSFKASDLKD